MSKTLLRASQQKLVVGGIPAMSVLMAKVVDPVQVAKVVPAAVEDQVVVVVPVMAARVNRFFVGADALIGPPFDKLTVISARSGNGSYREKQHSYRTVLGQT